jgi:hypothetical protein
MAAWQKMRPFLIIVVSKINMILVVKKKKHVWLMFLPQNKVLAN